jgi:hypothetical protein
MFANDTMWAMLALTMVAPLTVAEPAQEARLPRSLIVERSWLASRAASANGLDYERVGLLSPERIVLGRHERNRPSATISPSCSRSAPDAVTQLPHEHQFRGQRSFRRSLSPIGPATE